MKRLGLLLSLVLLVALAACGGQDTVEPTPTAAVEAAPTEAPPAEAPATEAPAEPSDTSPTRSTDPVLVNTLWLWVSRDAAEPLDVPDPQNYNLVFNEDGTFFAGLDCNRGSGTFDNPMQGEITMTLGPTTRAFCAEGSLADQMIAMIGSAESYTFEQESEVVAFTMADGSVDRYRKADTMTEALPAVPGATDIDPAVLNRVWQWTSRASGETVTSIPSPEDYTLTFNDDGTFYALLDCNNGGGSYTADTEGNLTLSLVRTTLAMCPPGSLADMMSTAFGQTVIYALDGSTLTLTHPDGTVDTYVDESPTLTGVTWQWLGTVTGEGPITVADSSRYTVDFLDDGTAAIKADCNRVVAQYTADGGAITITPGPSTMAACPEDSQADQFVQQLSGAALYFFLDGDLYIDLFADSGTMRFGALPTVDLPEPEAGDAVGTVTAPDGIFLRTGPGTTFPTVGAAPQGDSGTLIGISEDGAWYVVEAPSFPGGQVWVAAAFVEATNADDLPVVPAPAPAQSLVGQTWLWTSTVTPVEVITAADPTRYTVDFLADGTAAIGADCNRVIATYTVDGQSITITPGPSTMAMCPEDSQADLFVQQLSNAALFFFQGSDLLIDQFASAGTMRFVTSVATVAPPPVTETVSGLPFRVVSFGPAGAETPVLDGTMIDAVFDQAGGMVSGNAGCNSYSGAMNTADGAFELGPFASTMMFCEPQAVMDQEAAYLAALSGATGFQWSVQPNSFITNGQITYTLADGTNGVINFVSP